MANQGPINHFPLNGLFDESVVGFVPPAFEVGVLTDLGHTVAIGNCHIVPAIEVDKGVAASALQATMGVQFSTGDTEVLIEGLIATDTFVEVNAEVVGPMNVDTFGIFQPVVGVGYTVGFRPFPDFQFATPSVEAGYAPAVDELGFVSISAILPAWWIFAEGTLSQTIQQDIVEATVVLRQSIEIEIFEIATPAQVIQIDIINQDIQTPAVVIEQVIFEDGQPSVTFQQENVDETIFKYVGGQNECWRAVVTLGGVDVSTDITGNIQIEAEENTARIATFDMRPPAGAINIASWVNQPVTIDYALFDPVTDLITTQVRVFGGTIDEPVYDPNLRIVSFTASDNLQQALEAMERATIDDLTPQARWSPLVFDEEVDNYEYAQDRLSTYPATLDKNIAGSFIYTPWAAKVTPDYTFTTANIVDESLSVELASRRDIVNRIELTFSYRYERLIERNRALKWQFPGTFCDLIGGGGGFVHPAPFEIPNRDMIQSAIDSSSWCAKSIAYGKLPRSQLVNCPLGLQIWVIGEGLRNFLVPNFSAIIQRRFTRPITEEFKLILTNPDSITLYGMNQVEREASVQSNFDVSEWEQTDECNTAINVTPIPSSDGLTPSCDSYKDTDDLADDGTDRTATNAAILVELHRARTEFLDQHRQNTVNFTIPLFPLLERFHTLEIDTATVDSRGKISKFTHSMDLTSGQATTDIELAISKAGGTTAVDTPLTVPTPPDTITPMIGLCEKPILFLDTRYGGIGLTGDGSVLRKFSEPEPPDDADIEDQWSGYIGNKDPADPDSENTYAARMAIPTDPIESTERDDLVVPEETPYTVAVPDELLNLFA